VKTACVVMVVLAAQPVLAQDTREPSLLGRAVEMPAHRSLQKVIIDPDSSLAPFETDGCSGGLSSTWRVVADLFPDFAEVQGNRPPWEDCCVVHDRVYHDAGETTDAEASFESRHAADEALRLCVIKEGDNHIERLALRYDVSEEQVRLAYEVIADAMYDSVRFGGGPCSGLPWRWGFGYPGCLTVLP